jgi:hypothetical protein
MKRWYLLIAAIITVGLLFSLSCEEEMVGAPCEAETDDGTYDSQLQGVTYSIEPRSVQCETRVCLTQTEIIEGTQEDLQAKYSFCSCRCKDLEGHTFEDDPDKYDDLCECPPNTLCEQVLGDIKEAPEKLTGSYCIPTCVTTGCEDDKQVCFPSEDSEKPWEWTCNDRKDLK